MENEEKKDIVMESEVVDEELKQEGGVVNDEATEPLVNEAMLNEMIEMGFPKARAMRYSGHGPGLDGPWGGRNCQWREEEGGWREKVTAAC